ncbi:MAG: SoxR reducing system RseC family protein [Nitrospirae bacterium]|nr:SoxR reducing system RseC family protein [Nitrospirota bacterium]
MEEEGTVVETTGNTARVMMKPGAGCEGCKSGSCKVAGGERILDADNPVGAKAGQDVLLDIGGGAFLKASFIVYMVPVIALFIGAGLGDYISKAYPDKMTPDFWQASLGIFFLVLSVIGIRLYDRHIAKGRGLRPVIVKVME